MLQNKLHFLVFRFIVPLLPNSHSCVQFSDFFFHDGHRRDRRQHGDGKLVSLVVRFKKLFFTKTLALHLSNEMSPNLD